jgi:hypothetical protein
MKDFQRFPWRYINRILTTRESFFDTSVEFTKELFLDQASSCPSCSKSANDLTWVPVDTADETWVRGEGRTGFVTCCMQCKKQIDFFIDDELTEIEAELRADGKSSQEIPWSESETVE